MTLQRQRDTAGRFDGSRTLPERFWPNVHQSESCWEWTGTRNDSGYGVLGLSNGRQLRAHRVAYELLVGPIPTGLQIDHLCRNRGCVNPAHMEPVTNRVNGLRGISPAAQHARATHCPKGHPYDEANTYHPPYRPHSRACRTCNRLRAAANYWAAR